MNPPVVVCAADLTHVPEARAILEAFGLLAAAIEGKEAGAISSEEAGKLLEKYLQLTSPRQNALTFEIEEAHSLLQYGLKGSRPGQEVFRLSVTEFSFLNYILSKPDQDQIGLDQGIIHLMAHGAILHGRSTRFWWKKLGSAALQLALLESIVLKDEDEDVIERGLALRPDGAADNWALVCFLPFATKDTYHLATANVLMR